MNLLYDHNLSPRLVTRLQDVFPDAIHVTHVMLDRATDLVVWQYAHTNNYAIVTKDSDFNDLSILHGMPPKVIWIATGNCSTTVIEANLRKHAITIHTFLNDLVVGVLTIY
jgi:predicted nuclease of predicted toxin-antitoxin system